jgi:capsular polysaccharide biosynthesis protein
MDQEMNQEVEIDLMQIIKVLLRKWYLIGAVTALVAVLAGLYAYIMLDDVYTAESSMIVQVTDTGDSTYTDLTTSQRLVATYTEIVESNKALNELRDTLNLTQTNSQLKDMISVSSTTNSIIVRLSVETTSPTLARDIANEIVTIVQELADDYEGLENVEVLDVAATPENPSGPNRMLYLAVGILLGGMIGVGAVLAIEFLDKNIKTAKDIEKVLGLRLLGTIPFYNMDEGVDE